MIFTIFTAIVFIAELIITVTVILNLIRLDKAVVALNETIGLMRPGIKDICILVRKISFQVYELSERYVNKFRHFREELIFTQISKIILGTLFFRKFRKSKLAKTIGKGLSLLQIVI